MRILLKITFFTLPLFTLLWLLPAPAASAKEWLIDIDHSAAHFSVKHLTIAMVRGHFAELTGNAVFDEKSGKMTNLQIIIGVKSVDTGVVKRDDHLRSADFFEADEYPAMTFISRKIDEGKNGAGKIVGDLTIKDTTREIVVDLHGPTDTIEDPWNNPRKGAKITATIDRTDFGIDYNNPLPNGGLTIGNNVEIVTDLEFLILGNPQLNP